MSDGAKHRLPISGRFSPLRYPGGKGKLARFVSTLLSLNKLQDGLYVEPYAGGAAIAWELLATGMVRRVHINDLSRPIYAFWKSVLDQTDEMVRLISDCQLDVETWAKMKRVFSHPDDHDDLQLGFSMFYLNRTNRSGILNGGPIGGLAQTGRWGMDARYNRRELVARIERIAHLRRRITLTNLDAIELLQSTDEWPRRTLIYLDPPYFEKGRDLYYNYYGRDDHGGVAEAVRSIKGASWMVSYDDVAPIHTLYERENWLQYGIGYSARNRTQGREAMFFSPYLVIPPVSGSMVEIDRWTRSEGCPEFRRPLLARVEPHSTKQRATAL